LTFSHKALNKKGMMLQENIYNKRDLRMMVAVQNLVSEPDTEWELIDDSTAASELMEPLPPAKAVVADKGYDSEKIREQIKNKGANAVIPRRSNSVIGNADMDGSLYRHRHLVENAFARLKHCRGLATRYDKLKRNYESVVAMACGFLWLPM